MLSYKEMFLVYRYIYIIEFFRFHAVQKFTPVSTTQTERNQKSFGREGLA